MAAKWLDFGYSEAGHMLNNFGIEGTSYTMKDNYPTYTETVTKKFRRTFVRSGAQQIHQSCILRSVYSGQTLH
ncbi:MAG: hypothetical protein L6V93_03310 [Clostridiales bacterium]|nr:MAG: hypothetical protein L6V93_03310 [Clostridiales bacterium]